MRSKFPLKCIGEEAWSSIKRKYSSTVSSISTVFLSWRTVWGAQYTRILLPCFSSVSFRIIWLMLGRYYRLVMTTASLEGGKNAFRREGRRTCSLSGLMAPLWRCSFGDIQAGWQREESSWLWLHAWPLISRWSADWVLAGLSSASPRVLTTNFDLKRGSSKAGLSWTYPRAQCQHTHAGRCTCSPIQRPSAYPYTHTKVGRRRQ